MRQRGQGIGVTGLISMYFSGVPENAQGGTNNPFIFTAELLAYKNTMRNRPIDRTGRGTAGPKNRLNDFSGGGTGEGYVQLPAPIVPSLTKYATANITFAAQKSQTTGAMLNGFSIPSRISSLEFSIAEKTEDGWKVEFEWIFTGNPVVTWKGNQYQVAIPSANDQETYEGMTKAYDTNGLISSATQRIDCEGIDDNNSAEVAKLIALAAAAFSPTTGLIPLKLYKTSMVRRTDSAGIQVVLEWHPRNSADDVTMPVASEWRSALSAWRSTQPVIVAASGTMYDQATNLWAAFSPTPFAEGVGLKQLNDNNRLAIYKYVDPGVELSGSTKGGRYASTRMNGTQPQVYIIYNLSNGSGKRAVQFGRQWVVDQPLRRFIIRRNLTGYTIPEQGPSTINGVTLPLIGQCNSAPFLTNVTTSGMSAGQVLYDGPKYTVRGGLSVQIPFFMGYSFTSDALGIVQGFPDGMFRRTQFLVSNATNVGWTNTSLLGPPFNSDITAPSQASFNAFSA